MTKSIMVTDELRGLDSVNFKRLMNFDSFRVVSHVAFRKNDKRMTPTRVSLVKFYLLPKNFASNEEFNNV